MRSLIIIIIFSITSAHFLNAEDTITVVTETWPPYNYEKNGVIKGTSTDIVKQVLDKAGIKYKIEIYPWARAYKMALKKENVLIYTIGRTTSRETLFKWIGLLTYPDPANLYILKERRDEVIIKKLDDIKHYKTSIHRGTGEHQFYLQNGFKEGKHFELVNDITLSIKKLAKKRVDIFPATKRNLPKSLQRAGMPDLKVEKVYQIFVWRFYFAFSKKTPDKIVKKVKDAYAALVKEGKIPNFQEDTLIVKQ